MQRGNASIQAKTNSTTENCEVTIWTTDFKVVGTIDKNGGILSWGEISANVPKLNVKVGDVISYAPSGTYEWNKEYAEDDGNGSITLSSAEGEAFNITTWKVLTVDNNGNIEIVPTKKGRYYDSNIEEKDGDILGETTGKVTLKGAQGYNNGVKLLNEACNSLYGNGSNIKGRSLNIEDIEKAIKASGNEEALNTAKGLGYPKQVESPFVSNNSDYHENEYAYPSIYTDEKLSVINGNVNTNTSALNLSQEPGDFIEKNEDGTGYTKTLSMQPYITYYDLQYSNLLNNTYISILGQLDLNETYHCWLASRSIWATEEVDEWSQCEFLISYLCSYCTFDHYEYLATSSGYDSYDKSFSICPVVSLNSDDLEKSNIQGIDFCVK